MAYKGLIDFISALEKKEELVRIKAFCDPVLEITEITDRISKSGGKALLFENTGKEFPVLINTFGSDNRMAMAIGRKDLDDAGAEIESIFKMGTAGGGSFKSKISSLPALFKMASILPKNVKKEASLSR